MPGLADQIREALAALAVLVHPPVLIGGLALAAHRVVRATRDVDFLVDADDAERVHAALATLGYACIHRSDDAANYLRGEEGLDVLYARRPEARRLMREAQLRHTALGPLHVIGLEGLIAFKLQGFVNDPARARDLDDIRALLHNNAGMLDMDRVRAYFALFEREPLLHDILDQT